MTTILDPSPLAPPKDDVLSPSQWETLLCLADTIIPSIRSKSTGNVHQNFILDDIDAAKTAEDIQSTIVDPKASSDLAVQYLKENATSVPGFKESLVILLGRNTPSDQVRGIRLILSALDIPPFALVLTRSPTPFRLQSLDARLSIYRAWGTSYIPALRDLHKSLSALFTKTWITLSPSFPNVIGFPRIPVRYAPPADDGFSFEFIQIPPGDQGRNLTEPETLEADVVVIGSGCGGGVTAKNLAEAGHNVMVVEQGYHFSSKHFPMTMDDGGHHLFANGGAVSTDDGSCAVATAQTWGGGGTVNWSASLQLPAYVRKDWASRGLSFFESGSFQASLDRVCDFMGVSTEFIDHNHANRVTLEGARKLGYAAKPVPQNTGHKTHYCGYCSMGCPEGEKQGPAVSWLPAAARAGATFLEGFWVKSILFESEGPNTRVNGIEGVWKSRDEHQGTGGKPITRRKVVIKAKKVVVSCGTLQSPLLLMRSGLKNPHIGRHLYLHPVTMVAAVFDHVTRPWEGGILTSVVTEFENLDGKGHGVKIENCAFLPHFILPILPWDGPVEFKRLATKVQNMAGFISVPRDRDTGRVYPDSADGRLRIAYTPSKFDRKHIFEGVIASAKISYICGAKEIHCTSPEVPPFIRAEACQETSKDGLSSPYDQGINDPIFQAWMKQIRDTAAQSRAGPLDPARTTFAVAHQMGSCRMGISPHKSVVDPQGQVWGVEGLYVADASVFPTASGVNPMVTNMATADWISRGISRQIKKDQGSKL